MKLILHFGMHKTGSSSIQQSLATNLSDPGFEYVKIGLANSSLLIALAFQSEQWINTANKSDKLGLPSWPIQRRLARSVLRWRLRRVKAETAILSAESLADLKPEGLEDLLHLAREYADQIVAVGYIRPPKTYVEGGLQQWLKRKAVPLGSGKILTRYRNKFRKFDRVFGKQNVSLWKYDPENLFQHDVVLDFCQRLGVTFDAAGSIRVNESLSARAVQLLYIYRQKFPGEQVRDRHIVARLATLTGPKLRFHSEMMQDVTQIQPKALRSLERRMQCSLAEDWTKDDATAIRSPDMLLEPDDAALEWLSANSRSGFSPDQLRGNTARMADAVANLRYARAKAFLPDLFYRLRPRL